MRQTRRTFLNGSLVGVAAMAGSAMADQAQADDHNQAKAVTLKKVADVPEAEILERLMQECVKFQDKVRAGGAELGEKVVKIVPPDPIDELGSCFDKIEAGQVEAAPTDVTIRRTNR